MIMELGEDYGVYGWHYRGIDDFLPSHTSVEAIACACLGVIANKGLNSLHLIGHSFGGWIGFELAHQLSDAGITVASLTLIDVEAPDRIGQSRREYTANEALAQWIEVLELAAGAPLMLDDSVFAEKTEAEKLCQVHKRMVRVGLVSARSRSESLQGSFKTFCAAIRTVYCPKRTRNMRVHLITADDARLDALANERRQYSMVAGWKQCASDLVHWHGPGNHVTILKPQHVSRVAAFWKGVVVPSAPGGHERGKGASSVY